MGPVAHDRDRFRLQWRPGRARRVRDRVLIGTKSCRLRGSVSLQQVLWFNQPKPMARGPDLFVGSCSCDWRLMRRIEGLVTKRETSRGSTSGR